MIECSILAPTGKFEEDVKTLSEVVPRILSEFWEARGRSWYKVDNMRIDAVNMARLWYERVLQLMLAREDGDVAGILMGFSSSSVLHVDGVFQVELCWGRNLEVEKELLRFFAEGFKFMPDRFVAFPDYDGRELPVDLAYVGDRLLRVYRSK